MPYREVDDRRAAARRRYGDEATIKKDVIRRKNEARKRNRDFVRQIKSVTPCADCRASYPPYVMQFDHLGQDKDRDVAALVASPVSLARLEAEIAKCEVVCANCHAERTHQRRALVVTGAVSGAGVEPTGAWFRAMLGCRQPTRNRYAEPDSNPDSCLNGTASCY